MGGHLAPECLWILDRLYVFSGGDVHLFPGPLSSPLLNGHFFKMYHTSAKVES